MDFAIVELAMRELALFAAAGFLVLGLSDLAVDLVWLWGALRRRISRTPPLLFEHLPPPRRRGRIAVFIPAWDESLVIGAMLRRAVAEWGRADYRLYVGCYPNDPATIAAVRAVADRRIRLVVGPVPGPTTKADCLNRLWEALLADEARKKRRVKAILLHDAEDVVHPSEPALFQSLAERHALVQIPVEPILDPASRFVGGHYADEFAESHGKELPVRQALGAAIPSAGVGCAFSRHALAAVASVHGGQPFDAESLTEDYELGLRLAAAGGSAAFVRVLDGGGRCIATREYFPGTFRAAVRQKARWMTGIALAGWDRLGWSGGLAERWMRLRDRQSLLAALLLFAGYTAAALWLLLTASGRAPAPPAGPLAVLLPLNGGFLAWRLAVRAGFVARLYGWRQGALSIARAPVANAIAMCAAWQALTRYRRLRRTGLPEWGKTEHVFPAVLPGE
jgi:adsorption protein B